MTEPTDIYNNT